MRPNASSLSSANQNGSGAPQWQRKLTVLHWFVVLDFPSPNRVEWK